MTVTEFNGTVVSTQGSGSGPFTGVVDFPNPNPPPATFRRIFDLTAEWKTALDQAKLNGDKVDVTYDDQTFQVSNVYSHNP